MSVLANDGVGLCPADRTAREVCEIIVKGKADLLPTTPTFLNTLIASGLWRSYDLSSLKLITYGAARRQCSAQSASSSGNRSRNSCTTTGTSLRSNCSRVTWSRMCRIHCSRVCHRPLKRGAPTRMQGPLVSAGVPVAVAGLSNRLPQRQHHRP